MAAVRDEALDPDAAKWRDCLLEVLGPLQGFPLWLSGGTDSGTLLAGLLALGDRPDLFTFRVGAQDSQDVAVARRMAEDHDLSLEVVEIPRNERQLLQDVRTVMGILGISRKAAIQCSQPVLHMATATVRRGWGNAIIGTGGVIEDNRKSAVMLAAEGEEAVRALRRRNLLDWQGSATGAMVRVGAACGLALHQPYATQPLADYGLSLDVRAINFPRQKGIALRAFPAFWAHPYWRKNSPLQVNSGVRDWHDTLLQSPVNRRGHKAVVGIYNDLLKEMKASEQALLG